MYSKLLRLFGLIVLLDLFITNVQAEQLINLWLDEVPNAKPSSITEIIEDPLSRKISKVTDPTIEVFFPARSNFRNKAVLICPGGGYTLLAYDKEGTDFAKFLNAYGYTAFVLKYRLPEELSNINPSISPLLDAQRAIEIIRANSKEWGIESIGIMGFSAGGHLAATLAAHHEGNRPDFLILAYPVVTMEDNYTHEGSKKNLLGENPSKEEVSFYSIEQQITEDMPPTFIVHSMDDMVVPIENSLQLAVALKSSKVPLELHVYPEGGHGFAFGLGRGRVYNWSDALLAWLNDQ